MNPIIPSTITTGDELNTHIRKTLDKLKADAQPAADTLSRMWSPIFMTHPVWAPSISALEWIVWQFGDRRAPAWVPTACTDGRRVFVNPTFFLSLPPAQRVCLICHEILHPLLNHLVRMRGWDHDIANTATDIEINNMLIDAAKAGGGIAPMEMIPDGCFDDGKEHDYRGTAAEVIAGRLADKKNKEQQSKQGKGKGQGKGQGSGSATAGDNVIDDTPSGDDEVEAAKRAMCQAQSAGSGKSAGEFVSPSTDSEAAALESTWREVAAATANAARQAGNAPGSWIEALDKRLKPPVDLRAILERYMTEYLPDGESDRAHRPTIFNHDMIIPDDLVEAAGTMVFVKDTSGSVSTAEAELVISCVEDAATRLACTRLCVLDVDHAVADAVEVMPGDRIPRTFKGRGGTCFDPAFKWTDEHASEVKALVYFTDGEGSFPPEAPPYPVIWIDFNPTPGRINYPFGEVIPIGHLMAH